MDFSTLELAKKSKYDWFVIIFKITQIL